MTHEGGSHKAIALFGSSSVERNQLDDLLGLAKPNRSLLGGLVRKKVRQAPPDSTQAEAPWESLRYNSPPREWLVLLIRRSQVRALIGEPNKACT